MYRIVVFASVLVVALPSLAAAQGRECGGHFIDWIGGRPQAARPPGRQHNPPTTTPFPNGLTQYDRMLWDQLVLRRLRHRAFCPSIGNRRPPQLGSRHPVLTGAPAVGAVRLFGEKPQESKRPPRLLAGLRRLEDDPLDDEQALARFTEDDLDPAQPGPHQIRSGVADKHVS